MIALTDAAIQEVLLGVVGHALWSLVAQSGARAAGEIRALISKPPPPVVSAIRTAADDVGKSLERSTPRAQTRLLSYLKSPEVESIVRQLFATSLLGSRDSCTPDVVRGEFLSSMSRYLDIDEPRLQPFATSFFGTLVSIVDQTLQAAIGKGVLSAHEAMSAARHQMLLNEIANVQKNLAFLRSAPALDVAAILAFEAKYREQVGAVHAHIKPPHLESGRRVPIDEIFVAPRISRVPAQKGGDPESTPLAAFLSRLHRAALLGNPGGGKSTVSAKICYDLATRYTDRLFAGREITPSVVILREYGSQRKANNCSIVQFLEQQASARYQLKPPADAFEYLLLNGRLLLVFDGLDELLESSYRQEITSNVESFSKLYPSVPVLVTSREVGYEQAPLNERVFELFRLAPFDDAQVREYADKWFARDEDYSAEQKIQKARAFFADSALVPDLRGNPLMLGLMCNLYRAEGYIPRNRPEVYGKCSVMLFERWDKSRGILVSLPFEEHIRPAMQDLAFWIYSNEALQGGVTEHDLIQKTGDYLRQWVFDDAPKAGLAAADFIRFCTGRAWVFTDTGTTSDGERLFQFTHRTFLEYFTACYLVSFHPTPRRLMASLTGHVLKREWDVVAQLAFQIQSKQVHGAADELLTLLLKIKGPAQSDRWNVLSFAERTLEFLVPSPKVRRQITRAALASWLSYGRQDERSRLELLAETRRDITEHIGNLLLVTAENRDTIADEIELFLKDAISSVDPEVSALGAGLGLDLSHCLYGLSGRSQVPDDGSEYWHNVSGRIVSGALPRIVEIAHRAWPVAFQCYWRGLIPLPDAVAAFGVPFLLVSVRSPALGQVWFYPPGYALVDSALGLNWAGREPREERQRRASELDTMAAVFLRSPTPWLSGDARKGGPEADWLNRLRHEPADIKPSPLALSPNAGFAVLCILAVDVEFSDRDGARELLENALRGEDHVPENVRTLLSGRLAETKGSSLKALDGFGLSAVQRDLLERWVNREIDLVEAPSPAHQQKRPGPTKRNVR